MCKTVVVTDAAHELAGQTVEIVARTDNGGVVAIPRDGNDRFWSLRGDQIGKQDASWVEPLADVVTAARRIHSEDYSTEKDWDELVTSPARKALAAALCSVALLVVGYALGIAQGGW